MIWDYATFCFTLAFLCYTVEDVGYRGQAYDLMDRALEAMG